MAALVALAAGAAAVCGADAGSRRAPTFHRDVLPLLQEHCQVCHRPGDIGPFVMMDHAQVAPWAADIAAEAQARRMPPWRPAQGYGVFHDERRLSEGEIATLVDWAAAGAPEGDPRDGPPSRPFTSGWSLGPPDLVLTPAEPYSPPAGTDTYRCFPVPTDFAEDRWVRSVDILPGDRETVHHVILYVDTGTASLEADAAEPGPGYTCFGGAGVPVSGSLGGWAPGYRPFTLDPSIGLRLPAGATIVVQVHYHPHDGDVHEDLTSVGLYFHDAPPAKEMFIVPLGNQDFLIPAGDPAHEVTASYDAPAFIGATVHTVAPHMHLIGKSMRVDATYADGTERSLIRIDDWDFRWQAAYFPVEPIPIPPGTRVTMRAVFDNSAGNPDNPSSPPVPVGYGEATTDEMAFAFLGVTLGVAGPPAPAPKIRRAKFDRRGRLRVAVRGAARGARIEVDGVPLLDTRGRRTLRSSAAADLLPPGGEGVITVRDPDGRRGREVPVERR